MQFRLLIIAITVSVVTGLLIFCISDKSKFEPILSEKLTQTSYKMLKDRGIVSVTLSNWFIHRETTLDYRNATGVILKQPVKNHIQQPMILGVKDITINVSDKIKVNGLFDKTIPVDKIVNDLTLTLNEGIVEIDKNNTATSTWNMKK